MPDQEPTSGKQVSLLRVLLLLALIIALLCGYFAFFVLPKELSYTPAAARALPAEYRVSKSTIDSTTIRTDTSLEDFSFENHPASDWTGAVFIDPLGNGRFRIRISASTLYDQPVTLEEFSASIVRSDNHAQSLDGVSFREVAPGEYDAEFSLPETGEWEVRARMKKGLLTIFLAQRIKPLLPR